jgi:hypothetical protein
MYFEEICMDIFVWKNHVFKWIWTLYCSGQKWDLSGEGYGFNQDFYNVIVY